MLKRILTAIFFTISLIETTRRTVEAVVYIIVEMRHEIGKTDIQRRREKDVYYAQDTFSRRLKRNEQAGRMIGHILIYTILWIVLIYTYRRLRKEEELIKKAKESR